MNALTSTTKNVRIHNEIPPQRLQASGRVEASQRLNASVWGIRAAISTSPHGSQTVSQFEIEYSQSEQEFIREHYRASLNACINFDGDIALCWAEMTDIMGYDIAWEIYDSMRRSFLAGWGTEKAQAWAKSISGEKQ